MLALLSLPTLIKSSSKHSSLQLSLLFGSEYLQACKIVQSTKLTLVVDNKELQNHWLDLFTHGFLPFSYYIIVTDPTDDSRSTVDLENWYCPCEAYQKCYVDSLTGEQVRFVSKQDKTNNCVVGENTEKGISTEKGLNTDKDKDDITLDDIKDAKKTDIITNTDDTKTDKSDNESCLEDNIIIKILDHCPSKLLEPAPICRHLLAVIIAGIQQNEVQIISEKPRYKT